jgi:hypothetical protein
MIDIEDRLAILDLCSRYNYYVDTAASERWADTFTPDGVFDGPAGHAEGRDALIDFCDGLAKQFPGGMHFTDNHLFEQDGDLVRHKCFLSFQVPTEGRTDLMLLGYEDEIVRADGEWRFRQRNVRPLRAD